MYIEFEVVFWRREIKHWQSYWRPHLSGPTTGGASADRFRCIGCISDIEILVLIHCIGGPKIPIIVALPTSLGMCTLQCSEAREGCWTWTDHPLLLGWEMRFTEDHVRYFVDHNTRSSHLSQNHLDSDIQPKLIRILLCLIFHLEYKHRTTTFEDPRPGGAKEGPKGAYGVPAQYERSFRWEFILHQLIPPPTHRYSFMWFVHLKVEVVTIPISLPVERPPLPYKGQISD